MLGTWACCAPPPTIGEGDSSKFDGGGGLSQYMGGAWGCLKCCWKIPVLYLCKLPAISLQACKFSKNKTSSHIFLKIFSYILSSCLLCFRIPRALFFLKSFLMSASVSTCNNSHTYIFNLLEKRFSFLLFILTHSYLCHTTLVTD